ncbi:MAG: hypothetical protein MZV65_00915 [Chromatiales bacterium]|nr:hypothetical protein [Chromatiales bacterium]
MILLDALELPDLTWTDPFDSRAVSVVTRRRLNGALTIFPRPLVGGRPITLEAPADQPLTHAQAVALAALPPIRPAPMRSQCRCAARRSACAFAGRRATRSICARSSTTPTPSTMTRSSAP